MKKKYEVSIENKRNKKSQVCELIVKEEGEKETGRKDYLLQ